MAKATRIQGGPPELPATGAPGFVGEAALGIRLERQIGLAEEVKRVGPATPVRFGAHRRWTPAREEQIGPENIGEQLRIAKYDTSGAPRRRLLGLDLAAGDGLEIRRLDVAAARVPERTHVLGCPRLAELGREPGGERGLSGRFRPEQGDAKRRRSDPNRSRGSARFEGAAALLPPGSRPGRTNAWRPAGGFGGRSAAAPGRRLSAHGRPLPPARAQARQPATASPKYTA